MIKLRMMVTMMMKMMIIMMMMMTMIMSMMMVMMMRDRRRARCYTLVKTCGSTDREEQKQSYNRNRSQL